MNPKFPDDATPTPELKALEAQLAALQPREDRLDRERLMYLAGRASATAVFTTRLAAAPWLWPASLGAAAGAAAMLAVVLLRPTPTPVGPLVAAPDRAATDRHPPDAVAAEFSPPGSTWQDAWLQTSPRQMLTASMSLDRVLQPSRVELPSAGLDDLPSDGTTASQPTLTTRSLDDVLPPSADELSS